MLQSRDKTIAEHRNIVELLFSPLLQHFLLSLVLKDITPLYQEKLRYNYVQSTFFSFFFFFIQKRSLHTKPKCVYDNHNVS